MTVEKLYALLQTELPVAEAMVGDRLGIQVEPPDHRIERVLTALEVTDTVLDEACQRGCNCIVTFHPLIFEPLQALRPADRVGRCVMRAIVKGIAIVSIHTTLDAHPAGTNATLAQMLGIECERPLLPSTERAGYGMGVVGRLREPCSPSQLARRVADMLGTTVRYCTGASSQIERVALVAGSGSSLLAAALESGVDAFITADVKYHTFHRASGQLTLIDAGHFEMEQHVPVILAGILQQILAHNGCSLDVLPSTTRTSPVRTEISITIDIDSSTIAVSETDAHQR